MCQNVLQLHTMWPAHRTRWWAILTHPSFGEFYIPDMPILDFGPSILAVMPKMVPMPSSQCDELELDRYELRQFHAYRAGISSFVINMSKALPTATHSWGSQAAPCMCGCRGSGFAIERLMEKGLHGVLHSLDGFVKSGDDVFHTMRHLHPQEVGLLNGLPPEFIKPKKGFHLRLELAAVGQMGSPLQSCWVLSNLLFQMANKGLLTFADHPRKLLWDLCQEVLASRDRTWKDTSRTRYQRIFETELGTIHQPLVRPNVQDEDSLTQELREVVPQLEANLKQKEPNQPNDSSVKLGKGKGGNIPSRVAQVVPKPMDNDNIGEPSLPPNIGDCCKTKKNEIEPPRAFHQNGGVTGFETMKRKNEEEQNITCKRVKVEEIVISPTLPWPTAAIAEPEQVETSTKQCVWVGTSQDPFVQVQITNQHVGQLCAAEAQMNGFSMHDIRFVDSMGQPLSSSKPMQEDMVLIMQHTHEWNLDKCPMVSDCNPPKLEGLNRIDALHKQKGWVALDEMEFYLDTLSKNKGMVTCKPLQLNETPGAEFVLEDWTLKNVELANVSGGLFRCHTAGFINNHWFPIVLEVRDDHLTFHSTPDGRITLEHLIKAVFGHNETQCSFLSMVVGASFPADCGFQTVAWLEAFSDGHTSCKPMTSEEATQWRTKFANAIVASDRHQKVCRLVLGGTQDTKAMHELQRLLEQHGVDPQRSSTCGAKLIEVLGIGSIRETLGAPRPWNDLKAKASSCTPPIQLVLSTELKKVIDERIRSGQAFGRKDNKKQSKAPTDRTLVVPASQVTIPQSVFQQEGGAPVGQIMPHEINPGSKGVVVLNIADALPFFNIKEVISQEGIGLLVLDYNDARLPQHEVVRFPATCAGTQEPMLMTAALIQLGRKKIERQVPETKHRIEEVATVVVRASVYKDEFGTVPWEEFCQRPVKHLFDLEEFEGGGPAIIDVWDRQFLTKTFKKCKPQVSELFIVTIRMTDVEGTQVINSGGKRGVYYEPRSASGRETHGDFGVVWLPKKSQAEVWIAKTTSPKPTWIARNGDRYGLRTALADIENIHRLHRPEIAYLNNMQVQQYRVGPLPFGTTRQSLQQAIKTWGWSARPGQPQGQTPDHTGVVWSVLATSFPTHWVYTMEHGDVLITKHEGGKAPDQSVRSRPIVASDRTLKHLSSSSGDSHRPSSAAAGSDSVFENDPWARWQKPVATAGPTKGLSANQIATIEANVERKVRESIQSLPPDDAMEPAVDGRVSQLESQVITMQESIDKMRQNMQTYQGQQQQHNAQVVKEITTIKTQVDQQNSSLKTMLDSKLEDQMNRIEALLCKRAKTNE